MNKFSYPILLKSCFNIDCFENFDRSATRYLVLLDCSCQGNFYTSVMDL